MSERIKSGPSPLFRRVSSGDGASEVLVIARLTGEHAGDRFWCEGLGGEYPYLVEVTTQYALGAQRLGLCDLDGEALNVNSVEWERAEDVPVAVLEQIEQGWATGLNYVERYDSDAELARVESEEQAAEEVCS